MNLINSLEDERWSWNEVDPDIWAESLSTSLRRIELYFTAAEFENVNLLMTKPPEFFKKMGEVVAQRTKDKDSEIEKLTQWVDDLHSGMYVNCVYCGHRYGPRESTPVSRADMLKKHIEKCPKHPMSKLKEYNNQLIELIKWIVSEEALESSIHLPEDWSRISGIERITAEACIENLQKEIRKKYEEIKK